MTVKAELLQVIGGVFTGYVLQIPGVGVRPVKC